MYGYDERIGMSVNMCESLQNLFTERTCGNKLQFDTTQVDCMIEQLVSFSTYGCENHKDLSKFYETAETIMQMGIIISERKKTNMHRRYAIQQLKNIIMKKMRIREECCSADCLNDVLQIMAKNTIKGALFTIKSTHKIRKIYSTSCDFVFGSYLNSNLITHWMSKTQEFFSPCVMNELKLTVNYQIPQDIFRPPFEISNLQVWYINVKMFWFNVINVVYYDIKEIEMHLAYIYTAICAINSFPRDIRYVICLFINV